MTDFPGFCTLEVEGLGFVPQVLTEHLLCAKHCSRCWGLVGLTVSKVEDNKSSVRCPRKQEPGKKAGQREGVSGKGCCLESSVQERLPGQVAFK